jgi:hypothetical protein
MDPTTRGIHREFLLAQAHSLPYINTRYDTSIEGVVPTDEIVNLELAPRSRYLHRKAISALSRSCLACRMNHPERNPFPAQWKALRTDKFGWTAPCQYHAGDFCHNCGREDQVVTYDEQHRVWRREANLENINLKVVVHGDTNEVGERRIGKQVCYECRMTAVVYEGERVIRETARGGPIAPTTCAALLEEMSAALWYVTGGKGTARLQAEQGIEELWLIDHTNWRDLQDIAQKLQEMELRIKDCTVKYWDRGMEFEEPEEYAQSRRRLLGAMRGGIPLNDPRLVWEDRDDMANLRKEWQTEYFLKCQLEVGDDDDEDQVGELNERVSNLA